MIWFIARALGLPVTGSSDAHSVERVGAYATMFGGRIAGVEDLAAGDGDVEIPDPQKRIACTDR